MRCQFCGKEIPDDSVFCPECGNVLNRGQEPDQSREVQLFCENCGARIQPGDTFCASCGQRTKNAESPIGYGQQGQAYKEQPYGEAKAGENPAKGKKSSAPIIIAIIACVLVILAGIGIAVKIFIFDKRDKDNPEVSGQTAVSGDVGDAEDEDGEEKEEERPEADIDLAESEYQTLEGELDSADGVWRLELDRPLSVYGRDGGSGENILLEDADYAVIDESLLPEGMLEDAAPEAAALSGVLSIRDGELYIRADKAETASGEDMITVFQEKQEKEEGGIHRYEFVVSDCTWDEAFAQCREKGGYLARINSTEEMEYIVDQMFAEGLDNINFFIGGRRDEDSKDYYWVNEDNQCYGEKLNDSSYSCYDYWMIGEPTFQDGDIKECYMNLFYYKKEGRTVLNDVPADVISVVASYSGHVGYICEYDD